MVYFNSDGNLGSMCGNGGRCAVAFAYKLNVFEGKQTTFMAFDGLHFAKIADINTQEKQTSTEVELQMSDISEIELIPTSTQTDYFLNTGSPHYVTFLDTETNQNEQSELENYEVVEEAKKVRYNERFKKEGTNVNFVVSNANNSEKNSIFVRTYERGVEDETLSCGTGVTACALAYSLYNKELDRETHKPLLVNVQTLGGKLKIRFDYSKQNSEHNFTNVFLIGAATAVFEGDI